MEAYKEVRSEAITTNIYKLTVEMVKQATLDLQLEANDYVGKGTQTLRSEITSIITVESTSYLQDSDKRIVKDAIIDAI